MDTETREPLRDGGNDDQLPSTSDVTTSGLTVSGIACEPASGSGDLAPRSQRPSRVSVQIKEPPVSEMRDYVPQEGEEEGEEEKKKRRSVLHRAIPVMPLSLAVTCCLLNILLPGFGKIINRLHRRSHGGGALGNGPRILAGTGREIPGFWKGERGRIDIFG